MLWFLNRREWDFMGALFYHKVKAHMKSGIDYKPSKTARRMSYSTNQPHLTKLNIGINTHCALTPVLFKVLNQILHFQIDFSTEWNKTSRDDLMSLSPW